MPVRGVSAILTLKSFRFSSAVSLGTKSTARMKDPIWNRRCRALRKDFISKSSSDLIPKKSNSRLTTCSFVFSRPVITTLPIIITSPSLILKVISTTPSASLKKGVGATSESKYPLSRYACCNFEMDSSKFPRLNISPSAGSSIPRIFFSEKRFLAPACTSSV